MLKAAALVALTFALEGAFILHAVVLDTGAAGRAATATAARRAPAPDAPRAPAPISSGALARAR